MFSHHENEMRRFVVDHMESQADRIIGDMRLLLQDQPPTSAAFPPRARPLSLGLWAGLAGFVIAFLFALQWFKQHNESDQLAAQLAQSQQQLIASQQNLTSLQAADAAAAQSAAAPGNDAVAGADQRGGSSTLEPVPFGEMPLGGARPAMRRPIRNASRSETRAKTTVPPASASRWRSRTWWRPRARMPAARSRFRSPPELPTRC
jgi:hypothetical protein